MDIEANRKADSSVVLTKRVLSVFTKIHRHEISRTLWLLSAVFLILLSYYLVKPIREGWLAVSVVAGLSKLEIKAYSGFLQAVVLVSLMPVYVRMVEKWPRGKLLVTVNLIFVAIFPIFWLLHPGLLADLVPYVGVTFYIWIGIFAVTVVAQFWVFAADLYSEESGKRLFPLIAIGASSGAIVGSFLAESLIKNTFLDGYDLLLIAPIPLILAIAIIFKMDQSNPLRNNPQSSDGAEEEQDKSGALKTILSNRYLLLIASFVLLLNYVVTNGENVLFAAVQDAVTKSENFQSLSTEEANNALQNATTAFYGRIYFWVNLVGLLLQAFVVSRLLMYGGLAGILLIPPVVSLAGYGTMAASVGIGALTVAKTAENATNYSLTNTARHVLWLPVARELLYKAKTAVDTICVRSADVLAALTALGGTRLLNWSNQSFFKLNILIAAAWLVVAVFLVREHRKVLKSRQEIRG